MLACRDMLGASCARKGRRQPPLNRRTGAGAAMLNSAVAVAVGAEGASVSAPVGAPIMHLLLGAISTWVACGVMVGRGIGA